MLFFSVKKKTEAFYLYFGLFSLLICVYIVSLQGLINSLVSNSDISKRLEFGSLMLAIPAFGMFLEALGRMGKTTKTSRGYAAFSIFICLTQALFCRQYGEEVSNIWNAITGIYATYLLVYEVAYFHLWKRQRNRQRTKVLEEQSGGSVPIDSILIGMARLVFTVRDTGIGIRVEDIKKLFASYAQLDTGAKRKAGGTGLGLAITKNLVEMMGGSIGVESEYGKGSVFTAEIIQGIADISYGQTNSLHLGIGDETAEALRNFSYASVVKIKLLAVPGCHTLRYWWWTTCPRTFLWRGDCLPHTAYR